MERCSEAHPRRSSVCRCRLTLSRSRSHAVIVGVLVISACCWPQLATLPMWGVHRWVQNNSYLHAAGATHDHCYITDTIAITVTTDITVVPMIYICALLPLPYNCYHCYNAIPLPPLLSLVQLLSLWCVHCSVHINRIEHYQETP